MREPLEPKRSTVLPPPSPAAYEYLDAILALASPALSDLDLEVACDPREGAITLPAAALT